MKPEATGSKSPLRVVALGGSLSERSSSLLALHVAAQGAREASADVDMFAVRDLDLPLFAPDEEPPPSARRLADAVAAADAMLWSSPMYHGSVSGSFKNAIDWLQLLVDRDPPYLTDKIIGLISTAGGVQGLQAINTMEFIVRALRGWAVPLVIPVGRSWQIFTDEEVTDQRVRDQLQSLGAEVVRAAIQFRDTGDCDYMDPVATGRST